MSPLYLLSLQHFTLFHTMTHYAGLLLPLQLTKVCVPQPWWNCDSVPASCNHAPNPPQYPPLPTSAMTQVTRPPPPLFCTYMDAFLTPPPLPEALPCNLVELQLAMHSPLPTPFPIPSSLCSGSDSLCQAVASFNVSYAGPHLTPSEVNLYSFESTSELGYSNELRWIVSL